MLDESTNAQAAPVAPPVPPAGMSVEEMQAKLADLEKARDGLIRDVQQERMKRQELEQRMVQPSASSAVKPHEQDELGTVLNPYIGPVAKRVEAVSNELESLRLEKAQNYLVSKTGKSWDQIETDTVFQDKLLSTARKYGLDPRLNIYERTTRAYELLQLEELRAKEADKARAAAAAANANVPTTIPSSSASGKKEYDANEFSQMSHQEYDKLVAQGRFTKTAEGKFVFIPNS